MDYGSAILDGAIDRMLRLTDYSDAIMYAAMALAVAIVAFALIKVLLRKRAKPEVLNGEFSLRSTGSIKGAFLFGCVVKNNGKKPCYIMDVQIKLPNSKKIKTGGRVNLYSRETDARSRVGNTKFPVNVSGPGQIPITVVGRANLDSSRYPTQGKVKLKIEGRRRPLIGNFQVNNRYLITSHRFK